MQNQITQKQSYKTKKNKIERKVNFIEVFFSLISLSILIHNKNQDSIEA
jgi:low temperature requirement protein LtrA